MVLILSACSRSGSDDDLVAEAEEVLTAVIISPDRDVTINNGEAINCTAEVSGGRTPYTYAWTFDGGAKNVTVKNPGDIVFTDPGKYRVIFSVRDADKFLDTSYIWVTVNQDLTDYQPTATIDSPEGDLTITAGETVNFQASASGGNGPLSYAWNFKGGAENSDLQDPGDIVFEFAGTYRVVFTVTDADGDSQESSVIITVNDISPKTWHKNPDGKGYEDSGSTNEKVSLSAGDIIDYTDCDDIDSVIKHMDYHDAVAALADTDLIAGTLYYENDSTAPAYWTGPLPPLSPYSTETVRIEEKHNTVQITVSGIITTAYGTESICGQGELDTIYVTIIDGLYDGYFFVKGTYSLPNGYTGTIRAAGSDYSQWTGLCTGDLDAFYIQNDSRGNFILTSKQEGESASGTISCVWNQPVTNYTKTYDRVYVSTCDSRFGETENGLYTGNHTGSIVFLPMYGSGIHTDQITNSPDDQFNSYLFLDEPLLDHPQTFIVQPSKNITINSGESVMFFGSVMGRNWPYTFAWDFDNNGSTDSAAKDPGAVVYDTVGTYTASFTVTDSTGSYNSDTITVTVDP